MSVKSCEKVEKSQVALTIEVGAAEFQAAVEKAYQKMRRKINVPGFRPGKAPRKLIEGMYGAEVFFEEAINIAFPDAYDEAVKEQELQVVGYPSVELVGDATTENGFTFKATVPVYPEVTLGEYKGLSAPKDEVKVSAADVDERVKMLQERNTRLDDEDRRAFCKTGWLPGTDHRRKYRTGCEPDDAEPYGNQCSMYASGLPSADRI